MSDILLDTKNVGDLRGKYYLPAYQRGYRWGEAEIKQMLDDLYFWEKPEQTGTASREMLGYF